MLEAILSDVISVFRSTFMSGDLISIAIALVSVLVAVFVMQRTGQIASMTLLALVVFVLIGFGRSLLSPPPAEMADRVTGGRAAAKIESGWFEFANMSAGTLLAYFIAFMLLIFVLFGLKSVIRR
ncbi:MAG: hypothetical protein AAFR21_04720 [Pseudomonadota bacterium]